jgi:hypothetical protein
MLVAGGQVSSATFLSSLRLKEGRTYTLFERMRRIGRIGVSLLSLLLLATPIMACLVPAVAMTQAERDCCKRMAHDCGNGGMMKSHSCCQSTTIPSHLATIKSSFDGSSVHLGLVFAHAVPSTLRIATIPEGASSPWATDIHSPPVSPPASISVLRI